MTIENCPYIGTWSLNGKELVQHTPDAFLSTLWYTINMRTKQQKEIRRKWHQEKSKNRPDGVCSRYPNCSRPAVSGYKMCAHHQKRSLEAKQRLRKRIKPRGECSVLECRNTARPGLTRCERCAANEAQYALKLTTKQRRAERRQEVRQKVLQAYGGVCVCCGEVIEQFLTIDHIHRFNGSTPRSGHPLYLWLIRHGFPSEFRVLCQNCNAALGKFGYCPHGNLVQPLPVRSVLGRTMKFRESHRARNLKDKLQAFRQYGGVCVCCGEEHSECLTIDHINNDGAVHRKTLKGTPIYRWLRQQGYPAGFQVLCWNCNFAKQFGPCPHLSEVSNGT